MTFTPAIIKEAYRESNLIAKGTDPDSDQSSEALVLLNRIVTGVYGNDVGDEYFDWPIGQDGVLAAASINWTVNDWQYLLPNVRMVAQQTEAQTVYMPPDPPDGARVAIVDPFAKLATYPITMNGNGRTIEGSSTKTLNTDNLASAWFYRADMGDWVLLSELTNGAAEVFPFPSEFDSYFITRLAMRLNPRYGRSMSDESVVEMDSTLRRLQARYRQRQIIPADAGVLALTRNWNLGQRQGNRIVRGRMSWMT